MKNLVAVFLLCYGVAAAQQFPICSFKMYSAVQGETPLTHAQQIAKTFPLYQSASFNYGLPFIIHQYGSLNTLTATEINQLLDAAAAHNINIILPTVVGQYSGPERFYLDASDTYFDFRRGSLSDPPYDAAAEQPSVFYDHTALKATIASEYMVKDAKWQPVHPGYTNQDYTAYFRLKVSRSGSPPPPSSTPVVDIEVWDLTTNTSYQKTTLESHDFTADDTYFLFSVNFNSGYQTVVVPAPPVSSLEDQMPLDRSDGPLQSLHTVDCPHSFDFRVYWHGQIQVWLDDIRIDGYHWGSPVLLFSGSNDLAIKNMAKQYNAHPALARFYLTDEPFISQYLSFGYVNERLREADVENGVDASTGKGLGYTAKTEWDYYPGTVDPYVRYTREAAPYELATDVYRFHKEDSLQTYSNYTTGAQNSIQSAIEKFLLAQQNSSYAESGRWHYFPNISRFPNATREPYLSEIYAQVNLALAYGAKGIHYFHYWTVNDGSPDYPIGLIDPSTLDPINSGSQYSVYGENKWDGIKALNQRLSGSFGTTLMGLTWQNAFSIHQQPSLAGTFVTTVSTGDAQGEQYVELAFFKDASNKDYFMVVNRRTKSDENRNITVTFNNSATWEIADVYSGNSWVVGPNGSFFDAFAPGEGKLYRVSTANYTATRVIPAGRSMKIAGGSTLTFANGTSLTVNGVLSAVGQTGAGRIHFGASNGSWSGILISGSGANGSHLEYVDVSDVQTYGGSAVSVVGASGVVIKHCDISDNVNYGTHGLYLTNAGSPEIAYNVINSNGGYGVCFYNTSGNIYSNTIEGNSSGGVHCSYYASPSFGKNGFAAYNGNNLIDGGQYGILAESYCAPYVGSQQTSCYGYNVITSGVRIRASGNCDVLAEQNFWDEPHSADFEAVNNSTIDWNPYLSDAPSGGGGSLKIGVAQATGDSAGDSFALIGKVRALVDAQAEGELDSHVEEIVEFLADSIDGSIRAWIYNAALAAYTKSLDQTLFGAVEARWEKSGGMDPGLDFLKANMLRCAGQLSEASQLLTQSAQRAVDRALFLAATTQTFYWSFNAASLADKSKGILAQMVQADSTSIDVKQAKWISTWLGADYAAQPAKPADQSGKMPTSSLPRDGFALIENYPNPFNPITTIEYQLPSDGIVTLIVYDALGREVATVASGHQPAGYYVVKWDASSVASGIYFARFIVTNENGIVQYSKVKKLLLMK
jgi:hypothetical protein